MIINDIANLADGTYMLDTELKPAPVDLTEGYWVGIDPIDSADLVNHAVFGVWTNDEGIKEFDKVSFEEDLETALIFAKIWNQKAIWDNKNGVEIPVTK